MPKPNNILTVIAIGYDKILEAVIIQLASGQAFAVAVRLHLYTKKQGTCYLAKCTNFSVFFCEKSQMFFWLQLCKIFVFIVYKKIC